MPAPCRSQSIRSPPHAYPTSCIVSLLIRQTRDCQSTRPCMQFGEAGFTRCAVYALAIHQVVRVVAMTIPGDMAELVGDRISDVVEGAVFGRIYRDCPAGESAKAPQTRLAFWELAEFDLQARLVGWLDEDQPRVRQAPRLQSGMDGAPHVKPEFVRVLLEQVSLTNKRILDDHPAVVAPAVVTCTLIRFWRDVHHYTSAKVLRCIYLPPYPLNTAPTPILS